MRLYVITRQDEVVPVEVNPHDSILRVQKLVMERQCLSYNSIPLDIHRTVGSYGLQGNNTLQLTLRRQDPFTLHIRTFSNWTFTINATRNDTLASIKYQIRNKEPLYLYERQVLFHNGLLMQGDDRPLSTFNIVGDTLMDLGLTNVPIIPTVPPTPTAAPQQIQTQQPLQTPVLNHTNNNGSDAITPQSNSNRKHAVAQSRIGVNETQHISSSSRKRSYPSSSSTQSPPKMPTPANSSTPSTVSPPAKTAPVTKTTIPPPKAAAPVPGLDILVHIQCHTKQIDIAINTADKVSVLKEKIFKHINVAATAQSLTHNGKRMNDDDTISTYNIHSEAKIDMLARPPRPSRIRKPQVPTDTYTPSAPSNSTSTSMDLLPVKSEYTKDPHKEILDTLYKWKPGDNGIINLLSSDEEEEEEKGGNHDEATYTKQVPSQQQQQQKKRKRKVKIRVQDGTIFTLEMDHSPDSTLLDVVRHYQSMVGQGNKQLSRKSIIFGGVTMEHEFLLDDLYLEEDSILNLV